MVKLEYFKLPKTGDAIPAIGFGSGTKWRIHKWGLAAEDKEGDHFVHELASLIKEVIGIGLVHIDTAEAYTTRAEVGEGIKKSDRPRSEIFLTDKWSPGFRGSKLGPYDSAKAALKELGQDYVDLFLIHSPGTERAGISLEDAWEEVIKLKEDGLAKNIGVSNFGVAHLEKIVGSKVPPQVNQIELHPYLQTQSPGVVDFCKRNDILVEAYCPLTPILKTPGPLDTLLDELSEKYTRPKSQILLRWTIQQGILPLTTSSQLDRIQDALGAFEFTLEDTDLNSITKLGREKVVRNFAQDLYSKYDDVLYQ